MNLFPTMTHRAHLGRALLCGGLAFLLGACSRQAPGEKTAPERSWAYEREFSGGPVSLVLRLDKVESSLSDQILLEEELHAEAGFVAEFPEFLPEDFEGFSVVEISSPEAARGGAEAETEAEAEAKTEADTETVGPFTRVQRLKLEPDRSGDLAIAPLAVYFHRKGEAKESSFLTEEIAVKVKPIEDVAALELRDLRGIHETPPSDAGAGHIGRWILAAAGALVLLAAAIWYLRRRPRKAPPRTPPQDVAYEALRRLVAMNLIEKGEIERFFVILSAILREYIENRFEVHAPERTTEEFLQEAARNPVLAAHRGRLATFLRLSDQVKFARYEPDEAAIQGAFDATKQFIQETISVQEAATP